MKMFRTLPTLHAHLASSEVALPLYKHWTDSQQLPNTPGLRSTVTVSLYKVTSVEVSSTLLRTNMNCLSIT